MFCPNCGEGLRDDAKFCSKCGTAVTVPEAVKAVEPEMPSVDVKAVAPVAEEIKNEIKTEEIKTEEAVTEAPSEEKNEAIPEAPAMPEAAEMPQAPEMPSIPGIVPPVATEKGAQEKTATQEQPTMASEPLDFTPLVAAPVTPAPKKKSKKGLIIGISAAAVVLGGAAVGYFGFHDDITRLIMGDAGYAKMIEGSSYGEYLGMKNIDPAELDKALAEQITTTAPTIDGADISDYIDSGSYILEKYQDTLSSFKDLLNGNNAVSADVSLKFNMSEDMLKLLDEEMEDEKVGITFSDYLELMNNLKYSYSMATGDVNEFVLGISDNSGTILTTEVYLDDKTMAMAFPEVTDKIIKTDLSKLYGDKADDASENDAPEKKELTPFDEAQTKRIREKITELYFNYFEKGTVTIEKDYELKYNDISIKGTLVKTEFDSVLLNNLNTEINDFLHNDTYVKGYFTGTLGMKQEDFDLLFTTKPEEKVNGRYVSLNLVDKHNNVIGKRVEFYDDKEESALILEYLNQENESLFFMDDDGSKLAVRNTRTDDRNGKFNLKFALGNTSALLSAQAVSIDVIYSDYEQTEYFGNKIPTGTVTVKLAEDDTLIRGTIELMSSLGSIADDYKDKAGESENPDLNLMAVTEDSIIGGSDSPQTGSDLSEQKIIEILKSLVDTELTYTCKKEAENLNVSYSLSMGELLSYDVDAVMSVFMKDVKMPDLSKAIDMKDDEEAEYDLGMDLLNFIKKLSTENETFSKVINVNDINDLIREAEEEKLFKENYSGYSEYTSLNRANNYASAIYEKVDASITDILFENNAEGGGVIKLYFDKEGTVNVIDDAGFSKTDFNHLLDNRAENCYAEITLDWKHVSGIGVTAVLTDSPLSGLENAPKWYNYQDGLYDWPDKEGYMGYYVAGTYPRLKEGTPTADVNAVNLDSDIAKLEEYAKTFGRFTENYLKSRNYTISDNKDYISLVLEKSTAGWQAQSAYVGIWEYTVDEVFDPGFLALYLNAMNSNTSIESVGEDVRVEIFFDNIEDDTVKKPVMTGVTVNFLKDNDNFSTYGKPQCDNYINGHFGWTGKEYLWTDAESGYYLGAGGVTFPLGTYCSATGGPLAPDNLLPGDYVLGKDIVSTYNYTRTDPFGINGVWTLTAINDIPLEQFAEENGYKLSELQKNLVIMDGEIEVEDKDGYKIYPITNEAYGFRLHYDEMRFADFTFDSTKRTLTYGDLLDGRTVAYFEFTEGYNFIETGSLKPEGDFDIASLSGEWLLTTIGGVPASESTVSASEYTITISSDGTVKICGQDGYVAVPTYSGFKIGLENINYTMWDLSYDENTDTLTDSTNGAQEIYLFERKTD